MRLNQQLSKPRPAFCHLQYACAYGESYFCASTIHLRFCVQHCPTYSESINLVPRPMVSLAKIPRIYAVSAFFIGSRGITFVHYQLRHAKVVDSFQDHLNMGMSLAYFFMNLQFQIMLARLLLLPHKIYLYLLRTKIC